MSKVSRFFPVALLVLGVGVATPACASQYYGYGQHGGSSRNVDRRAYDIGYREGLDHGQDDARRGRDFAYAHDSEYRNADRGYDRSYGNREEYRRVFRQAYETGYNEGYRSANRGGYGGNYPRGTYPTNPSYPTNPNYPSYPSGTAIPRGSYAAQNGYRDGIQAGQTDARRGDRFDPVRAKRYREGDNNYDSRYGSRDDYKREYRAAFQQGYDEGYRGTRIR